MAFLSRLLAARAPAREAFPSFSDSPPVSAIRRPHVLVVDDETLIADSVAAILNRNGYDAVARYSGLAAIEYLEKKRPDIVVTDIMLPDLDGVRVALTVREVLPQTRVVLFSGHVSTTQLLELNSAAANSFELLSKPVHPAQLLKALQPAG